MEKLSFCNIFYGILQGTDFTSRQRFQSSINQTFFKYIYCVVELIIVAGVLQMTKGNASLGEQDENNN